METVMAARRNTVARNAARKARDAALLAQVRAELSRLDTSRAHGGSAPSGMVLRERAARLPPTARNGADAAAGNGAAAAERDGRERSTDARALPTLARPVLDQIDRWGPCELADIPHRWPLTRLHVTRIVGELVDAGFAEWVAGERSGPRRVRLTEAGRRLPR